MDERMTASEVMKRVRELGHTFSLKGESFSVSPRIEDPELIAIIRENKDRITKLLRQESDKSSFQSWDDQSVNKIIIRTMEDFATVKKIWESNKKDRAYQIAMESIASYLVWMAEAIRLNDSHDLWRACDHVRWLAGQMREWVRDPGSKPPKELFLDAPK